MAISTFDQAKNPNTPPEVLEVLATDEEPNVRRWVAQNPNTSPEVLEILATDDNFYVRCAVARNPNATELIRRLVLMTHKKLSTTNSTIP